MKNTSKKLITLFALFLTLTMTFSLIQLQNASAHNPPITIPTWAYIEVAPNPVGVGQRVNVVM